jgi:hypothetical protein
MLDALDTMHLMGLHSEFQEAADYLAANLDFGHPVRPVESDHRVQRAHLGD